MTADSPRRSRLTVTLCVVTALYWLAIFALTHSPVVPEIPGAPQAIDKIAHLGVFAGLAFLLCAAGSSLGYAPRRVILAVVLIVVCYGLFDEYTQQFVPHRFLDWNDWIASMLGAGIGIASFAIFRGAWLAFDRRFTSA